MNYKGRKKPLKRKKKPHIGGKGLLGDRMLGRNNTRGEGNVLEKDLSKN